MKMTMKTKDVLNDGNWLAYRYQADNDAIHFRKVTRDQRNSATFLTDEYLGEDKGVHVIPRTTARADARPAPLRFIFHSAFCCSTLLARAFDVPGKSTALKEPIILNDLVGVRHRGEAQGPELAARLENSLNLLARPFSDGEAVVIKPSNVVNALAPAMLNLSGESRAVLLYAPLETYLKSIAKKGIDGRLWVRDLMVKQMTDRMIDMGFSGADYLKLTDLQAAAVGWLAQHKLFADMTSQFGPDRVRTLDSETLMARPEQCLSALARIFGIALATNEIKQIARGPAFTSHSKTGADFGAAERSAEYDAAAASHADEIMKVTHWAGVVAANVGISMALPSTLLLD